MFQYVHFFTRRELETEANAGGFSIEPTDVHDAYVLRPRSL